MEDYLDLSPLEQELEALSAIYLDELEICRKDDGQIQALELVLHPATGDDSTKKFVRMNLVFQPSCKYPDEIPEIVIRNPRGLGEEEVLSLLEDMKEKAVESVGEVMLYTLIEMAKETLTDGNVPHCPCVVCLEHFHGGDLFHRTACYHYFHNRCLHKYLVFSRQHIEQQKKEAAEHKHLNPMENKQDTQIVCPVCRTVMDDDSLSVTCSDCEEDEEEEFVVPPSIREQQEKMTALYERQKARGAIIDLEQEKNKYLVNPDERFAISPLPGIVENTKGKSSIEDQDQAKITDKQREEHTQAKGSQQYKNHERRGQGFNKSSSRREDYRQNWYSRNRDYDRDGRQARGGIRDRRGRKEPHLSTGQSRRGDGRHRDSEHVRNRREERRSDAGTLSDSSQSSVSNKDNLTHKEMKFPDNDSKYSVISDQTDAIARTSDDVICERSERGSGREGKDEMRRGRGRGRGARYLPRDNASAGVRGDNFSRPGSGESGRLASGYGRHDDHNSFSSSCFEGGKEQEEEKKGGKKEGPLQQASGHEDEGRSCVNGSARSRGRGGFGSAPRRDFGQRERGARGGGGSSNQRERGDGGIGGSDQREKGGRAKGGMRGGPPGRGNSRYDQNSGRQQNDRDARCFDVQKEVKDWGGGSYRDDSNYKKQRGYDEQQRHFDSQDGHQQNHHGSDRGRRTDFAQGHNRRGRGDRHDARDTRLSSRSDKQRTSSTREDVGGEEDDDEEAEQRKRDVEINRRWRELNYGPREGSRLTNGHQRGLVVIDDDSHSNHWTKENNNDDIYENNDGDDYDCSTNPNYVEHNVSKFYSVASSDEDWEKESDPYTFERRLIRPEQHAEYSKYRAEQDVKYSERIERRVEGQRAVKDELRRMEKERAGRQKQEPTERQMSEDEQPGSTLSVLEEFKQKEREKQQGILEEKPMVSKDEKNKNKSKGPREHLGDKKNSSYNNTGPTGDSESTFVSVEVPNKNSNVPCPKSKPSKKSLAVTNGNRLDKIHWVGVRSHDEDYGSTGAQIVSADNSMDKSSVYEYSWKRREEKRKERDKRDKLHKWKDSETEEKAPKFRGGTKKKEKMGKVKNDDDGSSHDRHDSTAVDTEFCVEKRTADCHIFHAPSHSVMNGYSDTPSTENAWDKSSVENGDTGHSSSGILKGRPKVPKPLDFRKKNSKTPDPQQPPPIADISIDKFVEDFNFTRLLIDPIGEDFYSERRDVELLCSKKDPGKQNGEKDVGQFVLPSSSSSETGCGNVCSNSKIVPPSNAKRPKPLDLRKGLKKKS